MGSSHGSFGASPGGPAGPCGKGAPLGRWLGSEWGLLVWFWSLPFGKQCLGFLEGRQWTSLGERGSCKEPQALGRQQRVPARGCQKGRCTDGSLVCQECVGTGRLGDRHGPQHHPTASPYSQAWCTAWPTFQGRPQRDAEKDLSPPLHRVVDLHERT